MSDHLAAEGINELAKLICTECPSVGKIANAIGPKAIGWTTQAITGSQSAGRAVDVGLTTLGTTNPNASAELLVGLAIAPVAVVASFVVAPIVLGAVAFECGKGLLNWLNKL